MAPGVQGLCTGVGRGTWKQRRPLLACLHATTRVEARPLLLLARCHDTR